MKLVKASYEIISPINGEEILKQIELAARTCYQSDGKIEYETKVFNLCNENGRIIGQDSMVIKAKSARELIPKLISRGHFAMLEFGGMITVRFIVDRGVSHELVRHRLASFAQESTRYCNYEGKDMEFIIPCWLDIKEGIYKTHPDYPHTFAKDGKIVFRARNTNDVKVSEDILSKENAILNYLNILDNCEEIYNGLINDSNWSPQQARSVLPNSLKTEINMSCNIREWREVFKQRCANGAHPQMQEVMRPLLKEFQERIPILFDDISY